MKRRLFVQHLVKQGCVLLREGARHSWYLNPVEKRRSAVPRHEELSDILAQKICKELCISQPGER